MKIGEFTVRVFKEGFTKLFCLETLKTPLPIGREGVVLGRDPGEGGWRLPT